MPRIKGMDRKSFQEAAEANGFEQILSDDLHTPARGNAETAGNAWVDVYAHEDQLIAVSSRIDTGIDHARLMRVEDGQCQELHYMSYLGDGAVDRDFGDALRDLKTMTGPFNVQPTSTLDMPVDHDWLRAQRGDHPDRTWNQRDRIETPVDDRGITIERARRLPTSLAQGFADTDPAHLDPEATMRGALGLADKAIAELPRDTQGAVAAKRASAHLKAGPRAGSREIAGIARDLRTAGRVHAKHVSNTSTEENLNRAGADKIAWNLNTIAAADVANEVAELRPGASPEQRLDGAIRQYADERIINREAQSSMIPTEGPAARNVVRDRANALIDAAEAVRQSDTAQTPKSAQLKMRAVQAHFGAKKLPSYGAPGLAHPTAGDSVTAEMQQDLKGNLAQRRADFSENARAMASTRDMIGASPTEDMQNPNYVQTHRRLKSAELISRAATLTARVADAPWKSLGSMITDRSGTAALHYWNGAMARTQHAGGQQIGRAHV